MQEPKADRAALLAKMREPFREKALKNAALYGSICAGRDDGMLEKEMNLLWLQSVTEGYETSALYYNSPLWTLICEEVFLRDRHRCAACHRDAEVVHHRSYGYDVMVGLNDGKLISLCKPCHDFIHFHESAKLPLSAWDKRLRTLQKYFARKRRWQRWKKLLMFSR